MQQRGPWDRWAVAGLLAWLAWAALGVGAAWHDQGATTGLEVLAVMLVLGLVWVGVLWAVRRFWPSIEDRSFSAAAAALARTLAKVLRWELVAIGVAAGLAAGPVGWIVLALAWRSRSGSRELRELRAAREALERERARLAGTAGGG